MDAFVAAVLYALTVLFAVGAVGCVFVIPVVAYRLFAVLMERDKAGET